MNLLLNGRPETTEAGTLAALLAELGLAEAVVATALNQDFVPREDRAATRLAEGDAVEIVAPMQGG